MVFVVFADDSKNIANILVELAKKGYVFNRTGYYADKHNTERNNQKPVTWN